jgi:hypothetical protein
MLPCLVVVFLSSIPSMERAKKSVGDGFFLKHHPFLFPSFLLLLLLSFALSFPTIPPSSPRSTTTLSSLHFSLSLHTPHFFPPTVSTLFSTFY